MKKNLMRNFSRSAAIAVTFFLIFGLTLSVRAQTTEFTFQGRLANGTTPANDTYDFEFVLYGSQEGNTPIGTVDVSNVSVVNGVFSVKLDFGKDAFPGADRFLEIKVRQPPGPFTILNPRQKITSTPYAIKAIMADLADRSLRADSAANATSLNGIAADQFVLTTDPRLTTTGNGSFIQNGNSLQTGANFNIDGIGTANIFNARVQYSLAGNRILSSPGPSNIFVGVGAGASNSGDNSNSFFGSSAGSYNTTGRFNSFVGVGAGASNTTGIDNVFFGAFAGGANTTASANTFTGSNTGRFNTTGNTMHFSAHPPDA